MKFSFGYFMYGSNIYLKQMHTSAEETLRMLPYYITCSYRARYRHTASQYFWQIENVREGTKPLPTQIIVTTVLTFKF
jgi:hypothetical protein